MRCGACGHENRETAAFCESCGNRLAPTCARCGAELRPTARFCDACGQARAGPDGSAAAPAPRTYTPRHLAEKIVSGRDALTGERKQVTVLFADVVGSTALIHGRDAEEAQVLLDGVVQVMMDAVHRYEGTVSRLMGDGLMAMFGAPVAHEDHAVRACYAALAMLDGVRRHGEMVRRAHGITPSIRVGLSAGEVIVRTIRDDLHMDYTAMGQTVHLASRMEQLARPETAVLTPETLALVEGYVQVRSLGPVPIKGLPDPVEAFELVGVGQARTRLQAAAARGLTRFVGRDAEMAALYASLTRAGTGQGQIAALVGEPGVGKSRLVWELTHSHRTEGWRVLESGSVSYGKATTYLPVIDLLKSYCRIETHDDDRSIREKLLGKLLNLDDGLRPTLPAFLELLGVDVDDAAWSALEPGQRRRQTHDAVKRLLLRESQEQPLLLVFEDLHWIDAESQALLDSLVESLPTARIMLLVNYRPEYTHTWGSRSCYTQLRIDPLGPRSAEELLAGLLGSDATLGPLTTLLTERTEGNPLFLEESVRSLVETGLLIGERGAYRLSRPIGEVRVPATVQAVLAARIDRLPLDAKQLLQTAAVIGKDVPDAVLRAVADDSDDRLERGLAVLRSSEFLYAVSLFPEPEYTFKHALTHEVAYGSLLQDRRKTLHARIGDAIEQLYADRLDEYVERLAQHALSSERWERAVAYLRQAGQRALDRSAYGAAFPHFERALTVISHLPDGRDTLELAADLHYGAYFALRRGMGVHRSLGHLQEVERLAETLDDRPRLGRVAVAAGECHYYLGDYERGAEMAQRALAIGEALGDRFLRVHPRSVLAMCERSVGDYRGAMDHLTATDAEVSGDPDSLPVYVVLAAKRELSWNLWELGSFAEASRHAMEGLHLAEQSGGPDWVAFACQALGFLYLRRGWVDQAVEALERSMHLCETLGLASLFSGTATQLGAAYVLAGRASKGLALVERGEQQAVAVGRTGEIAFRAVALSDAHLALGRREDALALAQHALQSAVSHQERGDEAYALRVLGEIAAQGEPPAVDEAETRFWEALALAKELGMRPLQARCHLGLGTLYRAAGRPAEARTELSTAVEMLHEMEMTHWLRQAEAELTLLSAAPAQAESPCA